MLRGSALDPSGSIRDARGSPKGLHPESCRAAFQPEINSVSKWNKSNYYTGELLRAILTTGFTN